MALNTPKNLIIVGLCLVIVGVLLALLFRPATHSTIIGDLTPLQESELKANLVTLEGQNDSLRQELDKSKADGKEAATAFKQVIGGHKKEIGRLKERPIIVQLVEATPALDSLHKAYDASMVSYEGRIFSLTNELQQRDIINAEIHHNFERRLSQTEQLLADKTMEVEQSAKEIKKLRRKLFWTKVGGVIVLGGVIALSVAK